MTNQKLHQQIAELTEKLRVEKPELYKMLSENPVTIPDQNHPDLSEKSLTDYIITLQTFLSLNNLKQN